MTIKISLIAAVAKNNVIGNNNTLLWHIPEDFKYFKATTMGKPIIMGRKTYDSIGRPLPGRANIVITRNADWPAPQGITRVSSIEDAIAEAEKTKADQAFIIGGAQIYNQALPFATSIYLTELHNNFNGDTSFPVLDRAIWGETSRQKGSECATCGIDYDFVVYERSVKK